MYTFRHYYPQYCCVVGCSNTRNTTFRTVISAFLTTTMSQKRTSTSYADHHHHHHHYHHHHHHHRRSSNRPHFNSCNVMTTTGEIATTTGIPVLSSLRPSHYRHHRFHTLMSHLPYYYSKQRQQQQQQLSSPLRLLLFGNTTFITTRFRSSMKVRRRKRRKREREEALKIPQDVPSIMNDYTYITTTDAANEWAQHAMEEILSKYITSERNIYLGIHIVWFTPPPPPPPPMTMATWKKNISLPVRQSKPPQPSSTTTTTSIPSRRRIGILQVSIPQTPVAVFHFTAMMSNTNTNNNNNNNNTDGIDDTINTNDSNVVESGEEAVKEDVSPPTERKVVDINSDDFEFPIQLKKLLELSSVVICAIRANELVDQLYDYERINCRTRVDLVDLANKALSYTGHEEEVLQTKKPSTTPWKWNDTSLSWAKILDHLCYYFLTVTNRERTMAFKRPRDENDTIHTKLPQTKAMRDMLIRYYAAHAYHARLLTDVLLEMINEGELQFFHHDNEIITYMMNPNIIFHPTIDQLPEMLSINRKVAILMTDDEYESFIVDGNADADDDKPRRSTRKKKHQRRRDYDSKDEFLMKKPYSQFIVAFGTIQFLGEPHCIVRRCYNTSYLVGTDMYENEAIVKLQKVKHPNFPIISLSYSGTDGTDGTDDIPYWKYPPPFSSSHPHSSNGEENTEFDQWPDHPTLGWVHQNAIRPHIIVDQSRLILFTKQEIIDPTIRPWLGQVKKVDLLPPLPNDISKYL